MEDFSKEDLENAFDLFLSIDEQSHNLGQYLLENNFSDVDINSYVENIFYSKAIEYYPPPCESDWRKIYNIKKCLFDGCGTDKSLKKICKLPKLNYLKISNTYLQKDIFYDANSIKNLNLDGNVGLDLCDDFFIGLKSLITLKMTNCEIYRLPDGVFNGLEFLNELDLSNNRLRYIQKGVFSPLKKIMSIGLTNNDIKSIDKQAFDNNCLLYDLQLSSNKLSGVGYDCNLEFLNTLSSLSTLQLSSNGLKNIPKNAFANLKDVNYIYMNDNLISELDPQTFEHNANLYVLELNKNFIREIHNDTFKKCENLDTIYIKNNPICLCDDKIKNLIDKNHKIPHIITGKEPFKTHQNIKFI